MGKALGMDKSTYYKWLIRRERQKSRQKEQRKLIIKVSEVFQEHKRVHGYRKMKEALESEKIEPRLYKIRKIIKQNGLYPEISSRFKPYPEASHISSPWR